MADVFPERLAGCLSALQKRPGDQVAVDEEQRFVGFDAYQKLIDSGVDVVILATPPQFRLKKGDGSLLLTAPPRIW